MKESGARSECSFFNFKAKKYVKECMEKDGVMVHSSQVCPLPPPPFFFFFFFLPNPPFPFV